MQGNFDPVTVNQAFRFPASTYNALMDIAKRDALGTLGNQGGSQPFGWRSQIIPVLNSSGSNVKSFEVLGINDSIITATTDLVNYQQEIQVIGSTPSKPEHWGRFCVTIQAIKFGEIGFAVAQGLAIVKVDSVGILDVRADIIAGSVSKLSPNDNGAAFILNADLGQEFCVVRLSNPGSQLVDGTIDLAMTRGDTVNMTARIEDGGGTFPIIDLADGGAGNGKIPDNVTLTAGNFVTATRGNPGRLISFDCDNTT